MGSRAGSASPPRATLPGSPAALAVQARMVLAESAVAETAAERFRLAHLAALRTAAAVFADRGRPARRRTIVSAWVLLDEVAPEYADWAAYFAAAAPTRAAVEAGAVSAVTARDADDQLRAASEFVHLVEMSLGLLGTPVAS
jgi:hypothetical protein